MRVPKDFAADENLEIGIEFKSSELGNFTATEKVRNLKFSKPPLSSFFSNLTDKNNKKALMQAFEKALEFYDDDPNFLNNYAWILVTGKDEKFRDPEKAIQLAEKAVKLTNGQAGYILDTLAVAYHEGGKLEEAVETIEKALPLSGNYQEIIKRAEEYKKELKEKQAK